MKPILANIVVDLFFKGGPIMYPLLAAAVVAIAVAGERLLWWLRESSRRDAALVARVLDDAEQGRWDEAARTAGASRDPVARVIAAGLGIAITTLIPLNILTTRLSGLQADIEAAATTLQVAAQKQSRR
jgi:biopolymer transport protein ExbB/TolQ